MGLPNNYIIDLRSDTVTKPCDEMRKIMYKAEVGDNFYNEDILTNQLEEYCANYFKTESALFVVSGTMANQIALRCHTKVGDEIITDNYYHILYYEAASTSDLGRVSMNGLFTDDGIITEQDLRFCMSNRHRSNLTTSPRLVWIENTINHYAGKIYPLEKIKKINTFTKENNLLVHLDGARLLNACVAEGVASSAYTPYVDSIMLSFSKGLGAPVGAILLGSKKFIEKAKVYQKWYGGGLHQSGILASAALFAIQHNIEKLGEDNSNAKLLSQLLSENKMLDVFYGGTNIVMFSIQKLGVSAVSFVETMKSHDILLYPWDEYIVRAVTHFAITKELIYKAAYSIMKNT